MNNLAYLISTSGGDLDEALTLARRARQLLPDMDEVSDTLGWIYLKKAMPEQAIELFDKLVQTKPERSTYHYHLALALSAKGDNFAAAEQLKAALNCNPGKDEAEKIRQMQNTIRR
jgi:tetratricopeptide (TPR) repeat protein